MKSLKRIFLALVLAMAVAVPASAQFRFGIKAGATINKLHFDKDVISSDNRTGFVGGVMAEFTAPLIGVGMDASILYANRSFEYDIPAAENGGQPNVGHKTRSYIDIPLNFKYKLALPGVSKIVCPFVTTGPDFSFLCSKKNATNAFKNKSFDFAWNFGLGIEFFRHLQVAASYGLGITNSVSGNDAMYDSKNRTWNLTAAWLF